MGKEKKIMPIDFQCGMGGIIPSTQEAFYEEGCDIKKRKEEKQSLKIFKSNLRKTLSERAKELQQFPTNDKVFIFILQYLVSEKEYNNRDVDNMAKTILDVLKGTIYKDDGQVKTLIVSKRKDKKIPQNFIYFAVKKIKADSDKKVLKLCGAERSIQYYNELKSELFS